MSEVLKFFREEIDPRFGDVNDRELSDFIKNEYPDFLQDEGFKSFVSEMESTPPDIPDELTGYEDPSFLEKIFNKLNSGKVGMEPTGGVTFDVNPIAQPDQEPKPELQEPDILADDIGKPVTFQNNQVPLFMREPGDVTRKSSFRELYGKGDSPSLLQRHEETDWEATAEGMRETDPTRAIPGGALQSKAGIEAVEAGRKARMAEAIDREKQKALEKGDSVMSYWLDRVPYLGGLKQANELALTYEAGERLNKGDYKGQFAYEDYEKDVARIGEYMANLETEEAKGWFRKAGDLLTSTPAFGVEIASTFGVFRGGAKVTENLVKKAVSEGIKKKLKGTLTAKAATAGMRGVGIVGGGMTQAFTQPQHIAKNFAETLASEKIQLSKDDQNQLKAWISEEDPKFLTALYEGYAKTAVEMVSEQMGLKAFKSLGKGAGEVMERLSPGFKAAIARRWFKSNPKKKADAFFTEIKNRGWNGVFGEMMEERYGELGRAALTRDELPDRTAKEWGSHLLMEASVFSIYGKGLRKTGDLYNEASFNQWMDTIADAQATALSLPIERGNQFVSDYENTFFKDDSAESDELPPVVIPIPEESPDQVDVPEPEVQLDQVAPVEDPTEGELTVEEVSDTLEIVEKPPVEESKVEEPVKDQELIEGQSYLYPEVKFDDLINNGVEIGLTLEQSREFFKLAVATSEAEKKQKEKTKDPVTGKEFSADELMNQLISEGKPKMGEEFSRRRGYTNEQIKNWNRRMELIKKLTSVQGVDMAALQALEYDITSAVIYPELAKGHGRSVAEYKTAIDKLKEKWKNKQISGEAYKAQLEGLKNYSELILPKSVEKRLNVELNKLPVITDAPKFEGNTFKVYQGSGRKDKKSVYAEGAEGPILGEGNYFAQTEDQAKIYGPKIKKVTVKLNNPAIINNDEDLMQFAPESYLGAIPNQAANINALMNSVRTKMEEQGHDGVVVNVSMFDVDDAGKSLKGLARLFGHSQIISFKTKENKTEPEVDTGELSESKEPKKIQTLRAKLKKAEVGYYEMDSDKSVTFQKKALDKKVKAQKALDKALFDHYKDDIILRAKEFSGWVAQNPDSDELSEKYADFKKFATERGMNSEQFDTLLEEYQSEEKVEEAKKDVPPPSTKATPANFKKQKAFLIDLVNQAIKKAPTQEKAKAWKSNKYVTFTVPEDGEFKIINTKETLNEFKVLVNKKGTGFPTEISKYQAPKSPPKNPRVIPALGINITPSKAKTILSPFTIRKTISTRARKQESWTEVATVEDGVMFATDSTSMVIAEVPNAKIDQNIKDENALKSYKTMLQFARPGAKIAGYDTADLAGLMHKALGLKSDSDDIVTVSFYSGQNGWSVQAKNKEGETFQYGNEGELIVSVNAERVLKIARAARQLGKEYMSIHIQEVQSQDQITDTSPVIFQAPGFTSALMPTMDKDEGTFKKSSTVKDIGDAPLASVEQSTLPRKIEAPHYKTGQVVGLQEIREFISKALDIPVTEGIRGKKFLGLFYPFRETIKMKKINDIPTLAHEVGHYLHYIMFPGGINRVNPTASDFGKEFDKELMELGKVTSLPSYSDGDVRKEGVAEFVRLYMTERIKAVENAPVFFKYFEEELTKFPQIDNILQEATGMIEKYIGQSWFDKITSHFGVRGQRLMGKLSPSAFLRKFSNNWGNENAPIERAIKQLKDYGLEVEAEEDAYELVKNYVGGWRGKVDYSLEYRQLDADGNDVGPSFKDVLSGVDDFLEFQVYLVALRAIEKNAQGKETGVDIPSAKQAVEKLKNKYTEAQQKLDKFLTNELTMLVDAGFLTDNEFDIIKDGNQFYVPFHRVQERVGGSSGLAGESFVDLSKGGLKGFYGSTLAILPPLESIIKNMYVTRDLVERNRIAKAFIDNTEGVRGGGRIAEPVPKKVKPIEVSDEEFRFALKQLQLEDQIEDFDLEDLLDGKDLSMRIWRAGKTSNAADGVFSVWRNGKQQYWSTRDPELYRALLMQDNAATKFLNKSKLSSFLSVPAKVLRAGATLTVEFMVRNPMRDQVGAATYSKYNYIPLFDGIKGIYHTLKKDKLYQDALKSGAMYSGLVSMDDPNALNKKLETIAPRSLYQRLKPWTNPLKYLRTASELMEQASRMPEFQMAQKATGSNLQAANAYKDITLNFSRMGQMGKILNRFIPFFNAGIQDTSKFFREHKSRPVQVMTKGSLWITLPSILLWFWNKDDEEIRKLPTWRRRGAWNINFRKIFDELGIDNFNKFESEFLSLIPGEDDFIMSIPKPFLLGHIYGTSVETALDEIYDKDPNAIEKFGNELQRMLPTPLIWDSSKPFPIQANPSMFPQAALPFIESATNKKFYSDKPLETQEQLGREAYTRANPQTSLISQFAARNLYFGTGVNVSPIHFDHFVNGWFAGLGKYGLDIMDIGLAKMKLADVPDAPEVSKLEYIGVRAFFNTRWQPSDDVRHFYDTLNHVEKMVKTTRAEWEDVDQKYLNKYKDRIGYYVLNENVLKSLRKKRKAMGDMTKAMIRIQADKKLTSREKTEELLKFKGIKDDMALEGLKLFHAEDVKMTK